MKISKGSATLRSKLLEDPFFVLGSEGMGWEETRREEKRRAWCCCKECEWSVRLETKRVCDENLTRINYLRIQTFATPIFLFWGVGEWGRREQLVAAAKSVSDHHELLLLLLLLNIISDSSRFSLICFPERKEDRWSSKGESFLIRLIKNQKKKEKQIDRRKTLTVEEQRAWTVVLVSREKR
jgi:hypothetical protein